MSFYAQMLLAYRCCANERVARQLAAMIIAGSPAPYMSAARQGAYK
jgi:hypothetical protein